MKKFLLLSLIPFLFPVALLGQSLTAADDFFEKGDFAQAKKTYQTLLPSLADSDRLKALLRLVACDTHLGEYLNAASAVYGYELPSDPLWKARFLFYRIETAKLAKNTYRALLPNSQQPDGEKEDLSQLTAQQWDQKINQDYEELWSMRERLINAPVEKETLILKVEDTDTRRIPTLFDVLVNDWKNTLSASVVMPLLRAENFVTAEYKAPEQIKNEMEKLASLLQTASQLDGKNRADAKIFWQVDRILLPFDSPQNFQKQNSSRSKQEAASLLENIAQFQAKKPHFFARLKGYVAPVKTNYAKAYAALRAAELKNEMQEYEQAVALCAYATKKLDDNYFTQACAQLSREITMPRLSVAPAPVSPNPADISIKAQVRNIAQIYVRIYQTTPQQLKDFSTQKYGPSQRYTPTLNSWNYLTDLREETMQSLIALPPFKTLQGAVNYDKPYAYQDLPLKLPALENGFYIVLFSDDPSFSARTAPVTGVVLNVTDLALFVSAAIEGNPQDYQVTLGSKARTLSPNLFGVYALNLKTGLPESEVDLTLFTQWKGTQEKGRTDENGLFTLPRKITVGENKNNSYFINPLAHKKDSYAFSNRSIYFHFYPNSPVQLYMETDRAIYRPGQTVHYALNAFETAARGLKTLSSGQVKIVVRDPNYEPIHTQTLSLNKMGTAAGQFTLPEEILLGGYSLSAEMNLNAKEFRTNSYFTVEDYKRPEYEVNLQDAKMPFEYDKTAQVQGNARYYFGTPLQKATVKYTVNRVEFRPLFCWWLPHPLNTQAEVVASGETQTDDKGNFQIQFTPQASQDASPAIYTVQAEAYDQSGRVVQTTKEYKASQKAHFFAVEFTQGFYDENQPATLASVQLTDINANPAQGKVSVEIAEVENVLLPGDNPSQAPAPYLDGQESANAAVLLESVFAKNKEIKKISSREIDFKTQDKAVLSLPALPEGIYKLTLKSNKADDQTLFFLVASPKSKLALPQIALAQHSTYYPGSDAKILIGAGALNAPKYVEIYQNGSFLLRRETTPGQVSIYTLPIERSFRGGVHLRWFGAHQYQTYSAQAGITVPHDNKQLHVKLTHSDVVKPGQKVNWQLSAKDATGNGVEGQASITVYDQALDYYAQKEPFLSLSKLFPQAVLSAPLENTLFAVYPSSFEQRPEQAKLKFEPLALPASNLFLPRYSYAMMRNGMARGARLTKAAAMDNSLAQAESAMADSAPLSPAEQIEGLADQPLTSGTQVRTDFSETAYYNPMLPLSGGKADLRFTMPQSLTAWNILGFVITHTADFGSFDATALTRKELMVRLSTPRFYREADQSQIQAMLTNFTQKKQKVQLELFLKKEGKNVATAFGITHLKKTLLVNAGETANVAWEITVPQGVGQLELTLTARSGQESDGEQKNILLLPSRQRLLSTTQLALENGANTLTLAEMQNATQAQPETAVLQLSPSLILTVLNTLPGLLAAPGTDLISQLNQYVPLAIINKFYAASPDLRKAVARLPRRKTITPAWQENPLRQTLLQETPWLALSQGTAAQTNQLTDLFNPAVVGKAKVSALNAILKYQNPSGAFSWIAGGEDDQYLTLYTLASFAWAQRFGAEVPQEASEKALSFITQKIEENLLQDKEGSEAAVSYALYAAYVISSYGQEGKEAKLAQPFIKKWMNYAEKYSSFMTPLGQTYAAAVFHRLGEEAKAQHYLTLVLSRMKQNSVSGAYFAPEAQSWVWYKDTMATQVTTLQTLLEVRPNAPEIDAMVKWILFNRQATQWDNPKATASAIYVLLDFMQKKGLLTQPSSYQIKWADVSASKTFEPFDWTDNLRFVKKAPQITPASYTAQINKKGGLSDFASLSVVYTDTNPAASPTGLINVKRQYFVKYMEEGVSKLRPLTPGERLHIADEVEVRLTLNTDSAFDYVLLEDPRPAGFESENLLSGWTYHPLRLYQENKDAVTRFYINHLPAGEVVVTYTLRPTTAGKYHALAAQLQSVYAPQFGAHTAADTLDVE